MNLKYTDKEGKTHLLNSYKVNNVIVSQVKGQSTVDVMSQKAVTDELNKLDEKIDSIDLTEELKEYEKTADVNSKLALKADKTQLNDYYTKSQSDQKFLTEHQSLSNYYNKTETDNKLNLKADKTQLENYQEKGNYLEFEDYDSNNIQVKLSDKGFVVDCGEY